MKCDACGKGTNCYRQKTLDNNIIERMYFCKHCRNVFITYEGKKNQIKLKDTKTLENIADEFNKIGMVNAVSPNELRSVLEPSSDSKED